MSRIFAFYFIGLSASKNLAQSRLVSPFDPIIIDATRMMMQWAGRASRGVTQLTGQFSGIFAPSFKATVDVTRGKVLLQSFIER